MNNQWSQNHPGVSTRCKDHWWCCCCFVGNVEELSIQRWMRWVSWIHLLHQLPIFSGLATLEFAHQWSHARIALACTPIAVHITVLCDACLQQPLQPKVHWCTTHPSHHFTHLPKSATLAQKQPSNKMFCNFKFRWTILCRNLCAISTTPGQCAWQFGIEQTTPAVQYHWSREPLFTHSYTNIRWASSKQNAPPPYSKQNARGKGD